MIPTEPLERERACYTVVLVVVAEQRGVSHSLRQANIDPGSNDPRDSEMRPNITVGGLFAKVRERKIRQLTSKIPPEVSKPLGIVSTGMELHLKKGFISYSTGFISYLSHAGLWC